MKRGYTGRSLGPFLMAEGLCPPNARNVELHIPADGGIELRYDVLVDTADLDKLARALAALAACDRESAPVAPGGDAP
jgi:hypothetical protein